MHDNAPVIFQIKVKVYSKAALCNELESSLINETKNLHKKAKTLVRICKSILKGVTILVLGLS